LQTNIQSDNMSTQSVILQQQPGSYDEVAPLQFDFLAEFAQPMQTMSEKSFDVNYLFGACDDSDSLEFVSLPTEEFFSSFSSSAVTSGVIAAVRADAPALLIAASPADVVDVSRVSSRVSAQLFSGEEFLPVEYSSGFGPDRVDVLGRFRPSRVDQSIVLVDFSDVDDEYSWLLFFRPAFHSRLRAHQPPVITPGELFVLLDTHPHMAQSGMPARSVDALSLPPGCSWLLFFHPDHHARLRADCDPSLSLQGLVDLCDARRSWIQDVVPVSLAIDFSSALYHVRVDRTLGRSPRRFHWVLRRVHSSRLPRDLHRIACVYRHGCDDWF
jgi:hypothetical protein